MQATRVAAAGFFFRQGRVGAWVKWAISPEISEGLGFRVWGLGLSRRKSCLLQLSTG